MAFRNLSSMESHAMANVHATVRTHKGRLRVIYNADKTFTYQLASNVVASRVARFVFNQALEQGDLR